MNQKTEAELVEAARGGDVAGFGTLYERHYRGVVGMAYAMLLDRHLAEDAAQETFVIACRDLGALKRPDRFAFWLGGICRNVARGIARSKARSANAEPMPDRAREQSDDGAADLVHRSIVKLPAAAREVVLLHYFSGLSHEETGAALGISPQAVHGRLIRARKKMAAELRRNGFSGWQDLEGKSA